MKCRICSCDESTEIIEAREMMLGLNELFKYFQCLECGCLQIIDPPEDMSKFYPLNYYSYTKVKNCCFSLKSNFIKQRDQFAVFNKGFFGRILYYFFPDESLKIYSEIPVYSQILDVGCGSGFLLSRLRQIGFVNLKGIDPYIRESIRYSSELIIEKKNLCELSGKYDLITYHHSFEHIADPLIELKKVYQLLKESGLCIIRIPHVDSFAWNNYKACWVQLDAPRHLYLYSRKSLSLLANSANLVIEKIEHDSTAFQFWGSEQYRKGVFLTDDRSYSRNPGKSGFTKGEIRKFSKRAKELNNQNFGDQAIFYIRKLKQKPDEVHLK